MCTNFDVFVCFEAVCHRHLSLTVGFLVYLTFFSIARRGRDGGGGHESLSCGGNKALAFVGKRNS